jgi:hypothetical protein
MFTNLMIMHHGTCRADAFTEGGPGPCDLAVDVRPALNALTTVSQVLQADDLFRVSGCEVRRELQLRCGIPKKETSLSQLARPLDHGVAWQGSRP